MVVRRGTALVLLAMLAAGCAGGGADATGPQPPPAVSTPSRAPQVPTSAPPTSPPSASAPTTREPAGDSRALPVYYVADTPAGPRLQREFHRVVTADPVSDAVRVMLGGPTGTDPDYRNPWPTGTALRAPVRRDGGVIVVDLSGLGAGQMGSQLAELAVQQLVFTVQGALQSTDPVRILADGHPVDELWGTVDTSRPVERGDPYALRSLVQIDTPAQGATVGRDVRVSGEAAVFEATVLWEVLRGGAVVRSGSTATAEGQRFAPYSFQVTLEPGEYVVRVQEDDPSGGEGRGVMTDDKAITVS